VARVRSYIVELQLPGADATDLAGAGERARIAAEELTRDGEPVRWVRSVYLPEDETCLLVFEARTRDRVARASHRAGLTHTRIVEEGRPT
jgi:hypothetical protein